MTEKLEPWAQSNFLWEEQCILRAMQADQEEDELIRMFNNGTYCSLKRLKDALEKDFHDKRINP